MYKFSHNRRYLGVGLTSNIQTMKRECETLERDFSATLLCKHGETTWIRNIENSSVSMKHRSNAKATALNTNSFLSD